MRCLLLFALFFLHSHCLFAQEDALQNKTWHILGFFDGENEELERVCKYNINQLEQVDSSFAKIIVVFDKTYSKHEDSSVRIYDIVQDIDRAEIISNSISIGERDMGLADVLDEFLGKYLGGRNVLIIKAHGYGIVSPPSLKIGYNTPQDPLVISSVLRKRLENPIEVMIFDSCNMASVEVAYEFKGLVSVMVASQDLMYYSMDIDDHVTYSSRPGIDCVDLVLGLTPDLKPLTVVKNVVASFIDIVNRRDALYYKATISALDLDSLDVEPFKKLADFLISGITEPETIYLS